jgi:predicted permease
VALGAGRFRIIRQLVIESAPLALLGAAGGLTLAAWATRTIAAVADVADNISYAADWNTIAVATALSIIALFVIGAVPAWKVSRQELMAAIKDGGQQVSITLDKARLRRFLMTAQVCGSCLVLVLAAMMTRTLQRVLSNDLGFEYEQTAVLEPGLGRHGFTVAQASAYWNSVQQRVAQRPEVASMSLAVSPPLGRRIARVPFEDAPGLDVFSNRVDPGFFQTMKIPLLAGRTFQAGDDPRTTVIVSRSLAQAMYGTLDVLGRAFPRSKPAATIVGVTGDAHAIRVEAANAAELYSPLTPDDPLEVVLIARAAGDAPTMTPLLRDAALIDSRILPAISLMRDSFERRVLGTQIASAIALTTGLLTLVIACLGIFGVVSYGATLRTKELGIHMALGAERASVIALVVRGAAWPVVIGMTVGVAAALPIASVLSSGPLQLNATDPAAYGAGLLLFVVSAMAAATLPALRVVNSDPVRALRHS